MKFNEKIAWYNEPEQRRWKRVWHVIELCLYSIATIVCAATLYINGDGTTFQSLYIVVSLSLCVSCFIHAIGIYHNQTIKRWHMQAVSFGYLSGAGLCALSGFLILSVQGLPA